MRTLPRAQSATHADAPATKAAQSDDTDRERETNDALDLRFA